MIIQKKLQISFLTILFILLLPLNAEFVDIEAELCEVSYSSIDWGDFDNDGDLDILLTGYTGTEYISKIYKNDDGNFIEIDNNLIGISGSSVDWGDFDNDGDLDILMSGLDNSNNCVSKIYRNDLSSFEIAFTDINADLIRLSYGAVSWGDYDNDGDLDFLLTGEDDNNNSISKIYENNNGNFIDINATIIGLSHSSVSWGDFDNDGDLDFIISGHTGLSSLTRIYRNDNGSFSSCDSGLAGFLAGSVSWGDYDSDGDLDILINGMNTTGHPRTKIYRNDDSTFVDIEAGIINTKAGSVSWGDYDNDGDLDILLTGNLESMPNWIPISRIYRNDNGEFIETDITITDVSLNSNAIWGDYDNDGDLDILLTGMDDQWDEVAKIYRNDSDNFNTVPSSPSNLSSTVIESSILFNWDKATDNETPQNGLSYNISIGNSSNIDSVKTSHSDLNTGLRMVVKLGNTNQVNSYSLLNVYPQCRLSWAVQAIDNNFAGSEFNIGDAIETRNLDLLNNSVLTANDSIRWESSNLENLSNYQIQISSDIDFNSTEIDTIIENTFTSGEDFIGIGLNQFNGTEDLINNQTYYWRIKPFYRNNCETFFSQAPESFIFLTGSSLILEKIPVRVELSQNYPNPFNPTTTIKYSLPNDNRFVQIKIFNVKGEIIADLVNKNKRAGFHTINFDGSKLSSGIYIYNLIIDNKVVAQKKMMMIE